MGWHPPDRKKPFVPLMWTHIFFDNYIRSFKGGGRCTRHVCGIVAFKKLFRWTGSGGPFWLSVRSDPVQQQQQHDNRSFSLCGSCRRWIEFFFFTKIIFNESHVTAERPMTVTDTVTWSSRSFNLISPLFDDWIRLTLSDSKLKDFL